MPTNNGRHAHIKINNQIVLRIVIADDSKPLFGDNINQVVNKATIMTNIIRRTFQLLDSHTFLSLYKPLDRSLIDCIISVWYE